LRRLCIHGSNARKESAVGHVQAIRKLIKSICASPKHHAVIISGPPGWGKSRSTEEALAIEGIPSVQVGAYTTALSFYNFLFEHSGKVIVVDDCAKLLVDSASMAILKAATWAGSDGKRNIRWGTTSGRAAAAEFAFAGKFVIICNSFPQTPDGEAIRSRSFQKPISLSAAEGRRLLQLAATDEARYENTKVATTVAKFLAERLTSEEMVWKISYRMLEMGYALAKDHPDDWQELLAPQFPAGSMNPARLVRQLHKKHLPVKEQARLFEESTGMSRRTFFNYRQQANLTR
jgi:hypothetical protein